MHSMITPCECEFCTVTVDNENVYTNFITLTKFFTDVRLPSNVTRKSKSWSLSEAIFGKYISTSIAISNCVMNIEYSYVKFTSCMLLETS